MIVLVFEDLEDQSPLTFTKRGEVAIDGEGFRVWYSMSWDVDIKGEIKKKFKSERQ